MEQLAQFVRYSDIADFCDLRDRMKNCTTNSIKNTEKDEAEIAYIGAGE